MGDESMAWMVKGDSLLNKVSYHVVVGGLEFRVLGD